MPASGSHRLPCPLLKLTMPSAGRTLTRTRLPTIAATTRPPSGSTTTGRVGRLRRPEQPRCDNGHGVPQNYAEARKWYRLAADQGGTSAQYNLGIISRDTFLRLFRLGGPRFRSARGLFEAATISADGGRLGLASKVFDQAVDPGPTDHGRELGAVGRHQTDALDDDVDHFGAGRAGAQARQTTLIRATTHIITNSGMIALVPARAAPAYKRRWSNEPEYSIIVYSRTGC